MFSPTVSESLRTSLDGQSINRLFHQPGKADPQTDMAPEDVQTSCARVPKSVLYMIIVEQDEQLGNQMA